MNHSYKIVKREKDRDLLKKVIVKAPYLYRTCSWCPAPGAFKFGYHWHDINKIRFFNHIFCSYECWDRYMKSSYI